MKLGQMYLVCLDCGHRFQEDLDRCPVCSGRRREALEGDGVTVIFPARAIWIVAAVCVGLALTLVVAAAGGVVAWIYELMVGWLL